MGGKRVRECAGCGNEEVKGPQPPIPSIYIPLQSKARSCICPSTVNQRKTGRRIHEKRTAFEFTVNPAGVKQGGFWSDCTERDGSRRGIRLIRSRKGHRQAALDGGGQRLPDKGQQVVQPPISPSSPLTLRTASPIAARGSRRRSSPRRTTGPLCGHSPVSPDIDPDRP